MKHVPVVSSAFRSFAYEDGVMEITFNTGKTYAYKVPKDLYELFLQAPSKGKFYGAHIAKLGGKVVTPQIPHTDSTASS